MHLKSMRASNERKPKQNWNLSLSLRQMRLNSDLPDSIELDKIIYVEKFNTQDSKHCFQSLRSLRQASSYPSVMKFGEKTATTPEPMAQLFNEFFWISLWSESYH